jgi:hypothetical protein
MITTMSHCSPHAAPGGSQDALPHAAQSGSRVARPSKLAAASAAKQAASSCACEQQWLLVKNNWSGRVESPPSHRNLQYQQCSDEKVCTSADVFCQRFPCIIDGGSKILFDPVSEEAKKSPTLKDNGVSKCSSSRGKIILSPSTAGEEAITFEEAYLAEVATTAPLEIFEGVIGVEEEEVNNVTSNTTHQPSMFDPIKDDCPICYALQLCCTPNTTNEELVICINCNHQAHKICTKQFSFQQPVDDNFVITLSDFSKMGKE